MKSNTRYLLFIWIVAAAVCGYVLFGFIVKLWQGDVWGVILPLVFGVLLVGVIKFVVGNKLKRLLQSSSADDLVAFYKKKIRKGLMPDSDAWLAHSCGLVYTLYGDYDAARTNLQKIDWTQRAPLIQACGRCLEALLCYFDTKEYQKGLELARQAQQLGTVSEMFPGAKTSAAAFQSYVEIGEVLCDQATSATVKSLEEKMKKLPAIGCLLVAWGLNNAYRKSGNITQADVMAEYIRKTAPHCRAIVT
jgi:hypothetical protein